ncbi:MAG: SurA N-terminal domain-containing protein [Candidatus Methylomirabilis sp.]|nr:SurA N-terminal domain-containing protein [Candidatus Methylomirabilis sp.]
MMEGTVLKRMRGYSNVLKVTLWLVIAAFVGTTFFVWGFRSTSGPGRQNAVAAVEGEQIPYTEYQQAYQRQYRQYQEQLGDKFSEKILDQLNLKGQVVEALIGRRLLLQEAKRLGIVISPDELVAEITTIPAFSDATGFKRDRYLQALQSVRLTPEAFEESLREDLLLRRVEQWVKGEFTSCQMRRGRRFALTEPPSRSSTCRSRILRRNRLRSKRSPHW